MLQDELRSINLFSSFIFFFLPSFFPFFCARFGRFSWRVVSFQEAFNFLWHSLPKFHFRPEFYKGKLRFVTFFRPNLFAIFPPLKFVSSGASILNVFRCDVYFTTCSRGNESTRERYLFLINLIARAIRTMRLLSIHMLTYLYISYI